MTLKISAVYIKGVPPVQNRLFKQIYICKPFNNFLEWPLFIMSQQLALVVNISILSTQIIWSITYTESNVVQICIPNTFANSGIAVSFTHLGWHHSARERSFYCLWGHTWAGMISFSIMNSENLMGSHGSHSIFSFLIGQLLAKGSCQVDTFIVSL